MQEISLRMIRRAVEENQDKLVDICRRLLRIPSTAPEAPTYEMAQEVCSILHEVPGAVVQIAMQEAPIANVIAVLKGDAPGRRLVLNGHLDTYPVTGEEDWTHDPFSGDVEQGKLYGRGACDMKCGVGCAILVFMQMAAWREHWRGELVLTLVGDEQSMGPRGTKYLLDTFPEASGDAMISADVGGPGKLYFWEKGYMWVEVHAEGVMTHGAQVGKGVNAIDRLIAAVTRIQREVPALPFALPPPVDAILSNARGTQDLSDIELQSNITVNLGYIAGGVAGNLVPDAAMAKLDIRLPAGATCVQVEKKLQEITGEVVGTSYRIWRRFDPNWSDCECDIFTIIEKASGAVVGRPAQLAYRIGASDAKFYRHEKNVPTVTCGLTAHNHGGVDEYANVSEMAALCQIYIATALEFLRD